MSKNNVINNYFNPISLDEYREKMSRRVINDPPAANEPARGKMKARILSINTNGTQSSDKILKGNTLRISKAKTLQQTVKKLEIDAIFQQEVRTGSWVGQFPNTVRIFESKKANVPNEGGRSSILIFNPEWVVNTNDVIRSRDVVIVPCKIGDRRVLLVSIYVHQDVKRAGTAFDFVCKQMLLHDRLDVVIGGDWNCVTSSTSTDVFPSGREDKSTQRRLTEKFVEKFDLVDPRQKALIPQKECVKYITRWDPRKMGHGRRIDRFYHTPMARDKVELWTEAHNSISDHHMIGLFINSETVVKNNAPLRIPRNALHSDEVKEFIKREWNKEIHEGMKGIRKNMEIFKKKIFEKIFSRGNDLV